MWLQRKGIILSVSLNGAMAEMSNQLESHLESGVTTPRLHQVKTGQKRSQLTLYYSLKSYGCSKNTEIFSFVSDSILQILMYLMFKMVYRYNLIYSSSLLNLPSEK